MADYGWSSDKEDSATIPPVWISVVGGNGQLIPVTTVPPSIYWGRFESNERDCTTNEPYLFKRTVPHSSLSGVLARPRGSGYS